MPVESIYDVDDIVSTFVEVDLLTDFSVVKETLERMGIGNNKTKTLYPSCYLLQKKGRYYIVHFKEMFKLDGRESTFNKEDKARRNRVAKILESWGLVKVLTPENLDDDYNGVPKLKILKHDEKDDWNIVHKYNIGRKRRRAA